MNKLVTRFARLSGVLARNTNKNAISVAQRSFSEKAAPLTPEQQQELLKEFQAKTGAPDMPDATVERLTPELEARLRAMAEADPYDIAASNPEPWKETPTPDGWLPGENDPTFVMPSHTTDHRPDLRKPEPKEVKKGDLKTLSFQTETRQMLDIVTNSLYTDKEVFLRELVSNASDALEKARYIQMKEGIVDSDVPFEIRIFADEESKTITLQDTGIGMTAEELVSHLGTIARSGSKQWVREVKDGNTDSIIGQFGVGFYSGFMVGEKIEVFTRSAKKDADGYVSISMTYIPHNTSLNPTPLHPLPSFASHIYVHISSLSTQQLCARSVLGVGRHRLLRDVRGRGRRQRYQDRHPPPRERYQLRCSPHCGDHPQEVL